MRKIGFITSGGDAPGMNACVRAITKICLNKGLVPIGFLDGYQGMIENRYIELTYQHVNNVVQLGGTLLGTARSREFMMKEGRSKAITNLKSLGVDGFVCIGGDGSFRGAEALSEEMELPIIGIPATIDNDIFGTDHTIGYDTALNTVVDAVDRIRDTAGSHHRIFFVEVMGRDAGFIALNSAIAAGAESVLIPERVTDIEKLASELKTQNKGERGSIVIVAEGDDGGGAMEIMEKVQPYLEGYELRTSILGHIQRGGRPSAFDRILATRMGVLAVELLLEGKSHLMIGAKGDDLLTSDLMEAVKNRAVPDINKLSILENVRTVNKK